MQTTDPSVPVAASYNPRNAILTIRFPERREQYYDNTFEWLHFPSLLSVQNKKIISSLEEIKDYVSKFGNPWPFAHLDGREETPSIPNGAIGVYDANMDFSSMEKITIKMQNTETGRTYRLNIQHNIVGASMLIATELLSDWFGQYKGVRDEQKMTESFCAYIREKYPQHNAFPWE